MSVNDISLAADGNDRWAATTDRRRAGRKSAARIYHIRILMSHVHEALGIVEKISDTPPLRAAVDQCDSRTQSAYQVLVRFIRSERMITFDKLRNRATFHYDRHLPEKSLNEIARADPSKAWFYSVGFEPIDWHFELADAVVDRMVIRDVFSLKEPRSPERQQKVEAIAAEMENVATNFTEFATYFVRHHMR